MHQLSFPDLGQVSDSSEIENIISQVFEEEMQAVLDGFDVGRLGTILRKYKN